MKARLARKHFKFIAAVLCDNKPEIGDSLEEIVLWEIIVEDFGDKLSDTSDEFSYAEFYEACGYDTSGRHWLAHSSAGPRDEAPAGAPASSAEP